MNKFISAIFLAMSLSNYSLANIDIDKVKVTSNGEIAFSFKLPYDYKQFNLSSIGDHIKSGFKIITNDNYYTVIVKHKETIYKCSNTIKNEKLKLMAISPYNNDNLEQIIEYKPCYNEVKTSFETEHPYKNNTNITKTIPALCNANSNKECKDKVAYIYGESEKNYDFITISQNGKVLGKYSGQINKMIEIDKYLPITITFKSDYSITKSGISVLIEDIQY